MPELEQLKSLLALAAKGHAYDVATIEHEVAVLRGQHAEELEKAKTAHENTTILLGQTSIELKARDEDLRRVTTLYEATLKLSQARKVALDTALQELAKLNGSSSVVVPDLAVDPPEDPPVESPAPEPDNTTSSP